LSCLAHRFCGWITAGPNADGPHGRQSGRLASSLLQFIEKLANDFDYSVHRAQEGQPFVAIRYLDRFSVLDVAGELHQLLTFDVLDELQMGLRDARTRNHLSYEHCSRNDFEKSLRSHLKVVDRVVGDH